MQYTNMVFNISQVYDYQLVFLAKSVLNKIETEV